MSNINYLRTTGINTFLECSAKFYFQEIERIELPNKSYLAFGTSIHKTIAYNYSQKIVTKKDIDVEEAKDIFASVFEEEFKNVDKIDLIEEPKGLIKDQGIRLVQKYQLEIAPRVVPLFVEQNIKIKLKGFEYGLSGTIDLYDIDSNIVDHKTTTKQIKGIPEAYKRQISAYALLEKATGREVKGARIDYLKRDTLEIKNLSVDIDVNYFLNLFKIVNDSISKGIFIPNRSSFLCTKRFCKFYAECEKRFGGTVKP